jgi:hypothetical protein
MKYHRIRDWEKHFENNRTKEMKDMRWVPVPNKHDGEGYQRIMQEKDGISIYGCWHLILQVASKLRDRGTLLRDDGTPVTADILALKTGWRSAKDFQRALDFCSTPQVGWLEVLTIEGAEIPHEGAEIPQEPARNGMEWNGMEENIIPVVTSPAKQEINRWFRRRDTTAWDSRECKKVAELCKAGDGVYPPEFAVVKAWYSAKSLPKDWVYRRKDILTLLNNWNGEVDRAKQFVRYMRDTENPSFAPEVEL